MNIYTNIAFIYTYKYLQTTFRTLVKKQILLSKNLPKNSLNGTLSNFSGGY